MILHWRDDGWRKRFALLPIYLSDGPNKRVIWMQWVWKRFNGLWTEVSETDPRCDRDGHRMAETVSGSVHDQPGPEASPNGGLPPHSAE